jgi:predicted O-methyltransferase YrrM
MKRYTVDWFSNNEETWKKYFKRLSKVPIKALEIGSFEGRSAIWALENILTHPDSHITCIDDFSLKQHVGHHFYPSVIMRHFEENTKEFGNKIKLIKQSSAKALKSRELLDQKFDFIYIDGNRHSKHVLEDAVLAFPLLNINGYIVFDDYTNSRNHDYTCPKKGIDAFLDMYSDELKVIDADWQVIAKKVKPKKTLKPCRSEYYSRL